MRFVAEAAARQVLLERFPTMEGCCSYVITANVDCPLVPVYGGGAPLVQ